MNLTPLVAVFLLAGCATEGNVRSTMDRIVESWRGATEAQVATQWGPPQSRKSLGAGTEVLEWRTEQTGTAGGASYTMGARDPGGFTAATIQRPQYQTYAACVRRLTVSDGRVTGTDWEGNDCCWAAVSGMCRSWLNPKR